MTDEELKALRLPPLLEAKVRKLIGTEREVPARAFDAAAMLDRMLVWQIGPFDKETFGGGPIVMPENMRSRLTEEAARGIIISAGLNALNVLRGHGADIGHTVTFVALAPYRKFLDETGKKALVILRDGDIIDSEDLCRNLRDGYARIEDVGKGVFDHRIFVDKRPTMPLPEHDQEL